MRVCVRGVVVGGGDAPGRGQNTPGYLASGGQAARIVWGWAR